MAEAVLGLQQLAPLDQDRGHGVCRSRCRVTSGWPARRARSANQCPALLVRSRVAWSPRPENSHGPNRSAVAPASSSGSAQARRRHVVALSRHNWAVLAPRVSRRMRPVLVGPTTSHDVARLIVRMATRSSDPPAGAPAATPAHAHARPCPTVAGTPADDERALRRGTAGSPTETGDQHAAVTAGDRNAAGRRRPHSRWDGCCDDDRSSCTAQAWNRLRCRRCARPKGFEPLVAF